MRRGEGRGWELLATFFPVAVDVAHLLLFDLLNQPLRELLATPSVEATFTLLGMYLVYAVSLFFVGRLQPEHALRVLTLHTRGDDGRVQKTKTTWPQFLFFYPSFGFGIVMMMAVVTASGMGAKESGVSEGVQNLALGGGLVVFVVQLAAQLGDVEPRHAPNEPGYFATMAPVLLVSELMLNLSVALWHRFLGLDAGGPHPSSPSVAGFVVAAPLFLLFFAIPRFTLLSRSFTWPSLVSGVALALYELWQLLAVAPLM